MILNVEDLKKLYKVKVPRMFYDYTEGGSWNEHTMFSNTDDLKKILLRQRVGINVANRSIRSTMLGHNVSMPVVLAPIGMTGMQKANGEILAAQAAEEFGVPYCLSTMSICSIEDVSKNTSKPFWFQLYIIKDKEFTKKLIDRAKKANCSALVVTVDCQIHSQRHRDTRNGLSTPPKLTFFNILDMMSKPKWSFDMLKTKHKTFGNISEHIDGVNNLTSIGNWALSQFDPSIRWDDIKWIKDYWGGKLVIKGILDVNDALEAVRIGADAIVVSNHGGRQLDGAPSSISVLPEIVSKINNRTEVWIDSGIRSGQDLIKIKALGAKGAMLGRPYIYGLGALGKEGVTLCLEIIAKELDLTMAYCGHRDINEVDSKVIYKKYE